MTRSWVIFIAACSKTATPDGSGSGSAPAASIYDVVPVVAKQLDTTVRLPAELAPDESVAIYSRVNGFVDDIPVDRGSTVKKGELVARLSAPELGAQRAEAEAKLAAAKSTYDGLKSAAKTPGAVAGHDIEIAEAEVAADTSRVQSLRTLEGYLYIRAPFDGVVAERGVHPGALVGPSGTPIVRVQKIDKLRLTVAVPEADIGSIAVGTEAAFTVSTWPGQKFTGKIARQSHAIDSKTRTMSVELDVDNTGKKGLTPGAYAEVLWPVRRDDPSLFVPATAIATTTEKTYVDRVHDGAVEQVTVQRGVTVGELVEVFGPLAAGDQVLKRGSETIATGTKVSTKPWTPPDAGIGK
jgi:RND family efflux transporter MFP subunit